MKCVHKYILKCVRTVRNAHNCTLAGRRGGGGLLGGVFDFIIISCLKICSNNNRSKIKYYNMYVLSNNVKTHLFSPKGFSERLSLPLQYYTH